MNVQDLRKGNLYYFENAYEVNFCLIFLNEEFEHRKLVNREYKFYDVKTSLIKLLSFWTVHNIHFKSL